MIAVTRRTVLALLAALATPGARRAAAAATSRRWVCTYNECLPYVYDPAHGDPDNVAGDHPIPPGTAFEDLPADWRCPVCGTPKSWFEETDAPWRGTG
jgi:rubredoxin